MRNSAMLYSSLQADLKNDERVLCSDMNVAAVRALWLEKSLLKKFNDDLSTDADEKCIQLFKQSNDACSTFALDPKSSFQELVIEEVKSLFDSYFFSGPDLPLDLTRISEGFATGPGASLGVDSYNFYTKLFDSTLSSTSDQLYRLYRSAISASPSWVTAETMRMAKYGVEIVAGNRLSAVPKTSEISRSICTEPCLNMLFQKGIGSFLEETLRKRFGINLSTQPILNRELAWWGSVNGSFGTLDLSSASDSMSLSLIRQLVPSSSMKWFELSRSPSVTFPSGETSELHMVSSMGNAFTFPLMTLLFASIVVSCYRVMGIKPERGRAGPSNWAVFGDDIIVRKDAYHFVTDALKMFGFAVNVDKSFNSGYFRESCGGDFYRGHDVRGVYVKSLKTSADVYSAINRLIRWSASSGIYLFRTLHYLQEGEKFLPIPYEAGDAEGIKVPFAPPDLQRSPQTGGVIYYALTKPVVAFKVPGEDAETLRYPFGGREIFYNPEGVLQSFLGGFIRNGRVGIRKDDVRPKVRRRITSSWGYVAAAGFVDRGGAWKRAAAMLLA